MTNGEKFKEVFKTVAEINIDWWNAEYKEPTTKNDLSSETRKNSEKLENVSPVIDWNNCHTSEQLDSIATTKNDLAVDAVSRDEVCRYVAEFVNHEFSTREEEELIDNIITGIEHMPSVTPYDSKIGHCKDCKYFEYDSMANVIPLIVAHEICSKWGNGCKTRENGYCFLFEPKADMREVEE